MRGAVLASIFLLCGLSPAQRVIFTPAKQADILERIRNAPAGNTERAARLRALFREAGCPHSSLSEQSVEGAETPNIICRLPGEGDRTIVVGAHYDASSSQRPIDNWSGASLLPSLYQSLRPQRRRHGVVFVAFADHGNEPAGAEFFARHLSQNQLAQMDAMVNLDGLGFSPTKVWTAHSDKDLVHALVVMMYALKLPVSQIDIDAAGATDSEPFAARNVPQITIHSMTQANLQGGAATAFRPTNYYDTYRLICGYVAYLDEKLKPRTHRE